MLLWPRSIHGNRLALKTCIIPSWRPILRGRMLNHTNYHACSIAYILKINKHIFLSVLFCLKRTKSSWKITLWRWRKYILPWRNKRHIKKLPFVYDSKAHIFVINHDCLLKFLEYLKKSLYFWEMRISKILCLCH